MDILAGRDLRKNIDLGFVELIDCMPRLANNFELENGLDNRITGVARLSTGRDNIPDSLSTKNLIRYLYRHQHMSPFEFAEFDFMIKAPGFVKTHFFRHRTASVNEESRRYQPTDAKQDFYHPSSQTLRKQSKSNRQSSKEDQELDSQQRSSLEDLEHRVENLIAEASALNQSGLANELTRFCLPMATYCTFRFKIDLRNLLHLLKLRTAPDAQWETQQYANAILELVQGLYPLTFSAWNDYTVRAVTFSQAEVQAIRDNRQLEASKGEVTEFENKKKIIGL